MILDDSEVFLIVFQPKSCTQPDRATWFFGLIDTKERVLTYANHPSHSVGTKVADKDCWELVSYIEWPPGKASL
jgi:hypothetical protein